MASQKSPKTGFEKWQEGLSLAVSNAKWNAWDCDIQIAVNEYNRHLAGIAGYAALDWKLVKAMVWVETGADSAEWKIKPLQIGVPGDPGLKAFLAGNEGGDLIVPKIFKDRLTTGSVQSIPVHNIQAGIGYLLMRMAIFEHRSIPNDDSRIYEIAIRAGDHLDKIAKSHASTIDILRKLNPTANVLRAGQTLKLQKASVQRIITRWRHISPMSISQRYNGGGDSNYTKKLEFALSLVRHRSKALCAR